MLVLFVTMVYAGLFLGTRCTLFHDLLFDFLALNACMVTCFIIHNVAVMVGFLYSVHLAVWNIMLFPRLSLYFLNTLTGSFFSSEDITNCFSISLVLCHLTSEQCHRVEEQNQLLHLLWLERYQLFKTNLVHLSHGLVVAHSDVLLFCSFELELYPK